MLTPRPHPTRAFLFDLDGTLVDSVPGIAGALTQAFRAIGRPCPPGDVRPLIGPPIRTIARHLDPTLTDPESAAIEQAYRAVYDETFWRLSDPFPGVQTTLQILHQAGASLFLLTNKPRIPTLKILDHLQLRTLFTSILTRDSADPPFPSKIAMLAALLHNHRLSPATSVLIGDTAEDAEAAAAHQLPFVFLSYGYGTTVAPTYSLDHFPDLLQTFLPQDNTQ